MNPVGALGLGSYPRNVWLPLWKALHHVLWLNLIGQIKGIIFPKNRAYADNKSQLKGNGGKSVNKRKTSCWVVSNEDEVKGRLEKKDKKLIQMTVIAKICSRWVPVSKAKDESKNGNHYFFLTRIKWEKASLCLFTLAVSIEDEKIFTD